MKIDFLKNRIIFRTFAVFEAVFENGISFISHNTNNFFKQSPVYIGSYISSEKIDFLGNCYYDFPPGYNNEVWLVNEVIKVKIKKGACFENTEKDIILTGKDEKYIRIEKKLSIL